MFSEGVVVIVNRRIYGISFGACVVLAVSVKLLRPNYFREGTLLDVCLGSAPTFLYVLGLIFLVPLLKSKLGFSSYKKMAVAIAAGSLVYEGEQIWTYGTFDFYDLGAIFLALVVFFGIQSFEARKHNKRIQLKSQNTRFN